MEFARWEDTDPEVKAELEAMAGLATITSIKKAESPKRKIKKQKAKIVTKKSSKNKEKTSTSLTVMTDQMELLNVIKKPAYTAEEKYKVLEARDKLIRLRTKRNMDITSAKHIVGTCPDMCPEKERLMREVQHQVSLYEQEPGEKTMNPALAVKQYSRSSADQEVPLPHELRPVSVLQRTMAYLMHKIVDLCDNPDINLAEWYHFLWDRTRGIRKDITQQELCCRGSVELVEQCARFHIHCSARLVAEDLSVFDQKINTENLTKCLQTLKYMYHDLQIMNESCPNEAEFRGYIILLNLNDANFMWEVQQLRDEIQKSKEVKFALQVYSALDKNNYVRFFNLVRSTTYLNACILLRYFVQVRLLALKTIIKSFSPRAPHTQFPLEELENILAFEGIASTIDFVEYYGLQLNDTSTHIILDRRTFHMPALPYALDRAMSVIEAKRTVSVGEVICNTTLDDMDFDDNPPHDSFDSNGFLNISEYLPGIESDLINFKDEKTIKIEAKDYLTEDKSSDIFSKAEPIFHPNIFALKSSSESRSNSPFDTIDKAPETSQEIASFWSKPEKNINASIFAAKPDVVVATSQTSAGIVDVPMKKPEFGGFSFKPLATSSIFNTNTQSASSIFAKSATQSNNPPQQSPSTTSSLFPQTAVPWVNKPIFTAVSSNASKTDVNPSATATMTQTASNFKPGGFTFNLKTSAPASSFFKPISTATMSTQQQLKSNQDHLREQKEKAQHIQKEIEEKIRLENEKRQRLEEEKRLRLAAEEAQRKRLKEEEEAAKRKLEEDRRRKKEELLRKYEEQRRRQEAENRYLEERRRKEEWEIKSTVFDVMRDVVAKVECKVREDKLRSISNRFRLRRASFYFNRWRHCVLINKRKRKAIDQWPIWVNWTTLSEEAAELRVNNQGENLKYMKRYKNGISDEITEIHELKVEEIDLDKLTRNVLKRNFRDSPIITQRNFLKVEIFIASLSYMNTSLKWVENIVNKLFGWEDRDYELVKEVKVSNYRLNYCIKRKEGYKFESADGYIFIGDELSDEFYEDIKKVVASTRKCAKTPIAVLMQNDDYDDENLNNLVSVGDVSQYKVIISRYTPKKLVLGIENALMYLAESASKIPPLELDTLKSFLHKHLATEVWKRMTSFTKWNQPYKICLANPEIVINLYNEALNKLEQIALDPNSIEYSDFPEIFQNHLGEIENPVLPCDYKYFPAFWKNDSYSGKLKRVFANLTLPKFQTKWPPKDVAELEQMIAEFCVRFYRDPAKKIYKIIASILKSFDPIGDFSEIKNVLWSEVIEVLIVERLNEIDFALREPFVCIFDELFVVYDREKLRDYQNSTWFYLSNPIVQKEINANEYSVEDVEEELIVVESEGEAEGVDIDLEATLNEVALKRFDREERLNDSKRDLREFEMLMADLEQSMSVQKEISRRFDDILARALDG